MELLCVAEFPGPHCYTITHRAACLTLACLSNLSFSCLFFFFLCCSHDGIVCMISCDASTQTDAYREGKVLEKLNFWKESNTDNYSLSGSEGTRHLRLGYFLYIHISHFYSLNVTMSMVKSTLMKTASLSNNPSQSSPV